MWGLTSIYMHCFGDKTVKNKILSDQKKSFVFSDAFCSDNILFLATLSLKQRIYIEVRPYMCGDSRCGNINSNWWFGLTNSIGVTAGVLKQRLTLSVGYTE
jgi:hypothetical protein